MGFAKARRAASAPVTKPEPLVRFEKNLARQMLVDFATIPARVLPARPEGFCVLIQEFRFESYYRKLWIDDVMKKAAYPSA